MKNEKEEIITNEDGEMPIPEEPNKELDINGIRITLINEMIQMINDELNVTFTTKSSLDEVDKAFSENTEDIVYNDDIYSGYNLIKSIGRKKDNTNQIVYKVVLQNKTKTQLITDDQLYAIEFAKVNISDKEALKCKTIFDEWKTFINKKMEKGTRFIYENELWKARQEILKVLENQYPSIDTSALYERIDEEHTGTVEDPIPYVNTMEVFEGKYYLENGKIYKCIRNSGQPLYASCESLLGNYFELAA